MKGKRSVQRGAEWCIVGHLSSTQLIGAEEQIDTGALLGELPASMNFCNSKQDKAAYLLAGSPRNMCLGSENHSLFSGILSSFLLNKELDKIYEKVRFHVC